MTVGRFQVFVVLAFQISVVDLTVMLRNFEHISQYDDKRGIESNSLSRRVVTLCGCGALCGRENDFCKSFFYQKSERLCSLYTEDLFSLTLVNATGSKGYSLKRHTEEEEDTIADSTAETPTSTSPAVATTTAQETPTSTSVATTTAQETLTSTSVATTTAQETSTSTSAATTTALGTPTSTSTAATTTTQTTTTSTLPTTTEAPTTIITTTAAPPPGCPGGGDDDDDECDD